MSGLPPTRPRALRGYAPLAGLLVVFAAITAFVPTTGREEMRGSSSSAATLGNVATTVPGAATTVPGSTPGAAVAGGPGAAAVTAGGAAAGTSAGCSDRAQQVPGDPYSPPCITFSGANGGATSRGVTADSIVVSWRYTNDSALASAISSSVGNRVQINDSPADIRRTVEGLVEYFNANFQLYGRKIDIRWFEGKGRYQNEVQGAGQAEAGADAVAVSDEIGAFAEGYASSAAYADALARRQVIGIGLDYLSEEWHQERHPYLWGSVSCTTAAHQLAEYANKRLFGGTATWAGGSLQGQARRVAIIAPENSYYQECVRTVVQDLGAAGNELVDNLTYALDINTASQDTSAMVAKLAADGVTTVLCFTDAVSPVFYSAKAEQQNYRPEWVIAGTALIDSDFAAQQYSQPQWRRAFGLRTLSDPVPLEAGLPYQAFKSVRPDEEPAGFYIDNIYRNLYELVIGLQMAGPNLTPETFAAGFQAYPGGTGALGTWRGQAGSHSLLRDAQEVWWNPDATSGLNGQPGAYVPSTPRFEAGAWPAGPPQVFG